jgi:hypothetical protein
MHNLLLSEAEKNKILNQHSNYTKDYVFDFVITENEKYLILFDNVFIKEDGGKCIGTIWENTQIFDELLKESINKLDYINESIVNEFNQISNKIVWKKDEIKKWLNESLTINEEEGFFDKFISGAKEVGGKIMSSISNVAMSAFKQGILPLFRWIRRNATSNIGIVVDAIVAFFSFKVSSVIWFIIAAIDIYEIATGDYDPKEPERMKMPFFYLISDLLSAVLTVGFGVLFKNAVPVIIKQGIIKYPNLIKPLKNLVSKIPFVEKTIVTVLNQIKTKMPQGANVINRILSSMNNVFKRLIDFINRLLSKEGLSAAASGGFALGASKGIEAAINASGQGEKIGRSIAKADNYLQNKAADITGIADIGKLKVSEKSKAAALSFLDNMV